jgi:hypothetical protein
VRLVRVACALAILLTVAACGESAPSGTLAVPSLTLTPLPSAPAALPAPIAREYPGIAITQGGIRVRPGVAALVTGRAHCGHQRLLLLNLGWPVLAATLVGDDPAGLRGDVTAALGGDAAAGC